MPSGGAIKVCTLVTSAAGFCSASAITPQPWLVQLSKLHPLRLVCAGLPNSCWGLWVSGLNDGEEAFIKSRAHVRDRKRGSINLRVQAYSCQPVLGGRGEESRDTDLKAFSLNNSSAVLREKTRSSQFNAPHPFSLTPFSLNYPFISMCPLLTLFSFFRHSPLASYISTSTISTFHAAPSSW